MVEVVSKEQKRAIGEVSIDSTTLYQRLIELDVGEVISYAELSELVGRDVQNSARGNLITARKIAQRENRIVFGCIRQEGLKRLDDEGIVKSSEAVVDHIRRAARRAGRRLRCVANHDAMGETVKTQHFGYASFFGMIYQVSRPTAIKKLHGIVEKSQARLPLGKTLDAFK